MREEIRLLQNWQFCECERELFREQAQGNACPERAKPDFDDSAWEQVSVPHDFVIRHAPQKHLDRLRGYLPYGCGWYRKHFELPAEDEGRFLTLLFEGVASRCRVFLNGFRLMTHEGQFDSFEVDISEAANYGGDNVLAVFVDADYWEGWWYAGGGIYRPVTLTKREKLSVELDGIWIRPELQADGAWKTSVITTVHNSGFEPESGCVRYEIRDVGGALVASTDGKEFSADARKTQDVEDCVTLNNVTRWDIDAPYLYTVTAEVRDKNGKAVDRVSTRTGFRTIRFDAREGFFLNERHVKIKGVCCHQDYGLTGLAIPPEIERYRLEKLKGCGMNAYRSAHDPSSISQMDACDELGILVMDETRFFGACPEAQQHLIHMVRRDRNRPSVILWSVGNEEPSQKLPQSGRIISAQKALVRSMDTTRPVIYAQNSGLERDEALSAVDVIGINYSVSLYDGIHERFPDKPMLSSECCALGTTRGYYGPDDAERSILSAYDHETHRPGETRESTWAYIASRPYLAGLFVWAGVEHRGETFWPRLCSQSGLIDLYLQEKDAYYQTMAQWTEKPMVHLLPHWNWPGREGEKIRVVAYTNQSAAELYLNGKSLGRAEVPQYGAAEWQVPYAPGELLVKAFDKNGHETAQDTQVTTGAPVKLAFEVETESDGMALLRCIALDAQGRRVPTASMQVLTCAEGDGSVEATGSSVFDAVPPYVKERHMRMGVVSVLVKKSGRVTVTAQADGVENAAITLE